MTILITITKLRCEYLNNPLGLGIRQPRLSWVLESGRRGEWQMAYQILVASSSEVLEENTGDLWDTGRVESSQSVHVEYRGTTLKTGQRAWWKVRVWNRDGQPSAYSQPAWWEMGLLESSDWRGQWIGSGEADLPDLQPSPYLRKTFAVARSIRSARIYATAKGVYELRLNGQRVGDAVLAPGWTDYDCRIQYQTYDVTDQVRAGNNALGTILGTGWYAGYVGFGNRCKHYGSRPQVLLQLHLVYEDGSSAWITSDDSWKVNREVPIRYSDLLMGEYYDARLELSGWDTPDYDDSAWSSVAVQPRSDVPLVADCAEPVCVTQEIKPRRITRPVEGVYIYDMGQNMVGWVRLRVKGEAGRQVQLRFAEVLNPNGTLYVPNLRSAKQTDTCVLKGDDEEVFEPHFTFHGFRYVEVMGYPGEPTLDTLVGCVVQSDTPLAGIFECSNPLINQLFQNILWGQRGNFLSIPTDCPQRDERLGWLGDAQIFIRTACYNMDVAAFFTKWMTDVVDAQSAGGAFSDVSPRMTDLADGAPAWGDAGVIVPWTIYEMYGDTRMIERHWAAMTRWMDYLEQANPGLLRVGRLNNNFGDWVSLNAETPKDVLATAYFAYDAHLMARMASAIGKAEDVVRYMELNEAVKRAFVQAYVSEDGRIKGDTQTVYVLALFMDLLPDHLRSLAAQHLIKRIKERDWHVSTGFAGVSYLCPVLTEIGATDVAYRLLTTESFPSWLYPVKQGATTIWERWDGWTAERGFQDPGMNSFNHYAYGSIGQWLFQTVAGIDLDPKYPGFEQFIIHPQVGGGLSYIRAEYDSVRGKIASHWQLEGDQFTLTVTIPPNTTATVVLPYHDLQEVLESSLPIQQAEGVEVTSSQDHRLILKVNSGHYVFRCPVSALRKFVKNPSGL